MKLGVLASGTGTNLEAILDYGLAVEVVVVDRPCPATDIAARHGVPASLIERTSFGKSFDRAGYTVLVRDELLDRGVELVAMAGFGTILDPLFVEAFPGRLLNTHPALLPAFKGWHAVEDALAYGVKVTGVTVHIAVGEVDAGPILAQEAVPVLPGDDVSSLHERIKNVERRLFPETIAKFARGELS